MEFEASSVKKWHPSSPIPPLTFPKRVNCLWGIRSRNPHPLLLRYQFDVRVFGSLRNRRERSCSMSHAQQRKYRIGEQLDRKRSADLIIERSFGLIGVNYRPKRNHQRFDFRAALMIPSICLALNRFVPFCFDSCPMIQRTSGAGTVRRR
jgi:hypothetical protein